MPVTLSSRFPPQWSSPAPPAPDGLYRTWNVLLREGRREVPAQRLGGSWQSQQVHAGLLCSTHCSHSPSPFPSGGCCEQGGAEPRGMCSPCSAGGGLSRVCWASACPGLGGSLPSLQGLWAQHSTRGRRPHVPSSFQGSAELGSVGEELPGWLWGSSTHSAAESPVFAVFNKVHCGKADAEAPGSGAQQLILQTPCPAASGVSRHPLLPRLLKMEHQACGKHHSGIYPGPEMVLATPDRSQIPWTRTKALGSRWEVMNLLSLQHGKQGWSYGVPSGGKPRSRGRAAPAHSGTEPPKHLALNSCSPWLEQLQKFPFFPDSGSCV